MNSTAPLTGSLVVDEHHLTEDQLLAQAREFFANGRPNGARGPTRGNIVRRVV